MRKTGKFFSRFWADESGVSGAEYGLLLAIIGGAIAVAAFALGEGIANELCENAEVIDSASAC